MSRKNKYCSNFFLEKTNIQTRNNTYTNGVFIAIGLSQNTVPFKNYVAMEHMGYIQVYDHLRTSVEGVFAAGDVYDYKIAKQLLQQALVAWQRLLSVFWLDTTIKIIKKLLSNRAMIFILLPFALQLMHLINSIMYKIYQSKGDSNYK